MDAAAIVSKGGIFQEDEGNSELPHDYIHYLCDWDIYSLSNKWIIVRDAEGGEYRMGDGWRTSYHK